MDSLNPSVLSNLATAIDSILEANLVLATLVPYDQHGLGIDGAVG
jgi:phage tail protein X